MDFKELFATLRRRWLVIVSFFVVSLIAVSIYSIFVTPQYASSTRLFISADKSNTAEAYAGGAFVTQQMASYAQLATSRELMTRVIDKTGVSYGPDQLAGKISAVATPLQVLLDITVTDTNATRAQQLASTTADELAKLIEEIENKGGTQTVKATVVDPASFSTVPVTPNWTLNLAVAGVLGLVIGTGVALIRDLMDNSIKNASDITKDHDLPVMASVAFDKSVSKERAVAEFDTPRAEAFRMLRTNLQFLDIDVHMKSLLITSPLPQDGKTSTAVNLAVAVAQTGRRVLIVDGDLRRPSVASVMGLPGNVGLTNVLVGQTDLQTALQHDSSTGVTVLASGPLPPNPSEILQSQATHELFRRLENMFDLMIVDAPPLLPLADPAVLSVEVDGVIIVIRHGKTTRDQLRQSVERLRSVGARVFGVVANMTPARGSRFYGYETYGGYEQLTPEEAQIPRKAEPVAKKTRPSSKADTKG